MLKHKLGLFEIYSSTAQSKLLPGCSAELSEPLCFKPIANPEAKFKSAEELIAMTNFQVVSFPLFEII